MVRLNGVRVKEKEREEKKKKPAQSTSYVVAIGETMFGETYACSRFRVSNGFSLLSFALLPPLFLSILC